MSRFLEIGPDGVLSAMGAQWVDDAQFVALQRRDQPQVDSALTALARLFVSGQHVEWPALYAGTGARLTDLPTYPFQHRPYWLPQSSTGDVVSAGQEAAGHQMLDAVVRVADTDEYVFTGRLSATAHAWVAEHELGGRALVPGVALIDMAVRAADEAGCASVAEMVVTAPLRVPETGGVRIQLVVKEPQDGGDRPFTIHSCPETGDEWVLHATGTLASEAREPEFDLGAWPPADARPVPTDGFYDRLAENGYVYGPLFRGLETLWSRHGAAGAEYFAEVGLPEGTDTTGFGIHPGLFDSAIHPRVVAAINDAGEEFTLLLPFVWSGISLYATGATRLRVRMVIDGDAASATSCRVQLADETGRPVAEVRSVEARPVSADQPEGHDETARSLYGLEWAPAELSPAEPTGRWALLGTAGEEFAEALGAERHEALPDAAGADVLVAGYAAPPGGEVLAPVRDAAVEVLELVQQWLADDRFRTSRLVVLTRGAVVPGDEDTAPDLVGATVWGLLRSAQAEHPERIVLADLDDDPASAAVLPAVLDAGHDQVVVRAGTVCVPRLAPQPPSEAGAGRPVPDPRGTVLITGGTGALGALFARHLVTDYGVRHLLL
ncbi:polyketide synthase dehydratase domain-containing protein, partial [Streptomyces tendae]|uniref:polyketide synthase dehydratase domain-containing protein n=2 Tax=Streptomyces tendae TaxID=1932 RepID=UPI003683269D